MSNQSAKSPQEHGLRGWGFLFATLCSLWSVVLAGEIFRYQDEQGNWHFTDDPPERYESSVVPDILTSTTPSRDSGPTDDLAASLQSTYSPITPIAYATLAVVSIRAGSFEGSGFFCSEHGHILTSKHVVQPESKMELGATRGFKKLGRRFDVVLKDGTELVATLVKLSDDQDLALLKLNGYRTPFLRLDPPGPLSQGTRVFAIGSPLGMRDTVTSGVVTRIAKDHLLTDAQILPGSSGGPLIRESGEVLGINVSREVAAGTSKYAVGFGKAIPIALAIEAFPTELASSQVQAIDRVRTAYPGLDQPGSFGSDQAGSPGSSHEQTSASAPVRLIVSDENRSRDSDPPTEHESRSLDFPPEGGGIPPGISWPPE